MPTNKRYHGLDALRAFAMLLGIALHGGMVYVNAEEIVSTSWPMDPARSDIIMLLIAQIHTWRMQVFFLIAGFFACMSVNKRGGWAFIKNRLRRIAVPLVVGWFVMLPLMMGALVIGSYAAGTVDSAPKTADSARFIPVVDDSRVLSAGFMAEKAPPPAEEGISLLHLWFLYALLWLYGAALLTRWFYRTLRLGFVSRLDRRVAAVMRSRWRVFLLGIPSGILWVGAGGNETVTLLEPNFPLLIYYMSFFGMGWMLYRQPELLAIIRNRRVWRFYLFLAIFTFPLSFFGGYFHAVNSWVVILALIGLFEAVNQKSRVWVRYLADASYWVYLMHMPLVLVVSAAMFEAPWPALIKFGLMCGISAAILLVSYEWFVRYSFIGRTLNGRRQRGELRATTQII